MQSKLLAQANGQRTIILVLDSGEEALSALQNFARTENVTAASFVALGAFKRATVGWFDFERQSYKPIEVNEQCEVLSIIGDIATDEQGLPSVHVHAVLGLEDGSTRGGHLLNGYVRPTLEVTITEVPACLRRRKRASIGAALIDLGSTS